MPGFTKAVKQYLSENGCEFYRHGKGDHDIWWSPITDKKFVVDSNMKSRHTANDVLKQAGIGKKF